MSGHLFECCLAIGHFTVHVAQVTMAFHRTSHHSSGSSQCTSAIAVPSFTLRTALSATPSVSERQGVIVFCFGVNLDKLEKTLLNCRCEFFTASVTEEIFL